MLQVLTALQVGSRGTRTFPAYDADLPRPRGVRHDRERHRAEHRGAASEKRVFEPPAAFVERASCPIASIYDRAAADPVGFWAEQAERISWFRRWDAVMELERAVGQVVHRAEP